MKSEFEMLAGRKVTSEQYDVIEALYMESELDKYAFVKSLKGILKSIPEIKRAKAIRRMKISINGYERTPNGCYYFIKYVEVVDVDIKTGNFVVKNLDADDYKKLSAEGKDLNLSTWYDIHYINCVDEAGKPIQPIWNL